MNIELPSNMEATRNELRTILGVRKTSDSTFYNAVEDYITDEAAYNFVEKYFETREVYEAAPVLFTNLSTEKLVNLWYELSESPLEYSMNVEDDWVAGDQFGSVDDLIYKAIYPLIETAREEIKQRGEVFKMILDESAHKDRHHWGTWRELSERAVFEAASEVPMSIMSGAL